MSVWTLTEFCVIRYFGEHLDQWRTQYLWRKHVTDNLCRSWLVESTVDLLSQQLTCWVNNSTVESTVDLLSQQLNCWVNCWLVAPHSTTTCCCCFYYRTGRNLQCCTDCLLWQFRGSDLRLLLSLLTKSCSKPRRPQIKQQKSWHGHSLIPTQEHHVVPYFNQRLRGAGPQPCWLRGSSELCYE
jgi:hypothetical protein